MMTVTTPAENSQTVTNRAASPRFLPLALLVILLGAMWLALLARGLDLGFTGDLLDYAFHYERLGTFGGMHWLVTEHLERHLLAPLVSAPIAYLFPHQSAPWYAYAFFGHYASAVLVYLLADTVLRGRWRWLPFAAALLFAVHNLQIITNFEFPTGGHRNTALFISLVSLWLYLQYVRRGRASRVWLELSFLAYMIATLMYEQAALFFLLHPIIAYFEDRQRGGAMPGLVRWLVRVALDSLAFPLFFAGYLFVLKVLFTADDHLLLSPARIIAQVGNGLVTLLAPSGIAQRLAPAFQAALVPTLALGAALFALLAWLGGRRDTDDSTSQASPSLPLVYLACLGGGIIGVAVLAIAPTQWVISEHPRLIYPSGIGFAYGLVGIFGLLVQRVPSTRFVAAGLFALLVAAGVVRVLQTQDEFAAQNVVRQRALDAIHTAVPNVSDDPLPYILIYSDANPTTDLWLFAQDNRFPLMFDWIYGTDGLLVDALYFDLDPSLAPPDDLPGARYNGQYIVAESEGIYSPLKPYEPIDPSRLVIVYYDSATGEARVMDSLPPDVLARANIVQRADIEWTTNRALIAP